MVHHTTCDRCGKDRMLNEVHTPERQHAMPLREIIAKMRHDGCGGRAGRVELLTGIEAACEAHQDEFKAEFLRVLNDCVAARQEQEAAEAPEDDDVHQVH